MARTGKVAVLWVYTMEKLKKYWIVHITSIASYNYILSVIELINATVVQFFSFDVKSISKYELIVLFF